MPYSNHNYRYKKELNCKYSFRLCFQGTTWVKVGKWSQTIGVERENNDIIWPGNTKTPPTDKGLPGKTTFRIGFIAPIHPDLAGLSELGREFESAFRVAVEMMNRDLTLSVDFDIKIQDGGLDPNASCTAAAEQLVKDDVVAVIGAYRSSCSQAVADVLGKENFLAVISPQNAGFSLRILVAGERSKVAGKYFEIGSTSE